MAGDLRSTDYTQQLSNYIKKNLAKGYTIESLRWALVNQGHSRTGVENAVKLTNEQLALQAPKLIEKPVIKIETSPPIEEKKSLWQRARDFFM